jgi:hypothetical protein
MEFPVVLVFLDDLSCSARHRHVCGIRGYPGQQQCRGDAVFVPIRFCRVNIAALLNSEVRARINTEISIRPCGITAFENSRPIPSFAAGGPCVGAEKKLVTGKKLVTDGIFPISVHSESVANLEPAHALDTTSLRLQTWPSWRSDENGGCLAAKIENVPSVPGLSLSGEGLEAPQLGVPSRPGAVSPSPP